MSHLQPLLSHLISNSIVYNSTDCLLHVQVHIYLPSMLNVVSVYCIGIGKMIQKFIRIILYYGLSVYYISIVLWLNGILYKHCIMVKRYII